MGNGEWRMVNGERGTGLVQLKPWPPIIFLTLPKKSSKFPTTSPVSVRKSGQAYMGICPNHCVYYFFFGSLLRVLQD